MDDLLVSYSVDSNTRVRVSNGTVTQTFGTMDDVYGFFGEEVTDAMREGIHSQYTLEYISK